MSDLGLRSRSRIQGGTQRSSRVWSMTVLEIQRRCQCSGSRVSRSISNLKQRAQGKIQGSRIQRIKRCAKPGKELNSNVFKRCELWKGIGENRQMRGTPLNCGRSRAFLSFVFGFLTGGVYCGQCHVWWKLPRRIASRLMFTPHRGVLNGIDVGMHAAK